MKKIRLFLIIVVIVLMSKSVSASQISMGVYPPIFEIDAIPGVSISDKLTVFGSVGDQVKIYVKSFDPTDTYGNIAIRNDDEAIGWVQVDDPEFVLEGDSAEITVSRQVTFTVTVPKGESTGDHNLVLIYENDGKAPMSGGSGTKQVGQISSTVLLSVVSDTLSAFIQGEFDRFDYPLVVFQSTFSIQAIIGNSGDKRFKSYGNIDVSDGTNQSIYQGQLLPLNILVDSQRSLQNMVDNQGVIRVDVRRYGNWMWLTNMLPDILKIAVTVKPDNSETLMITKEIQVLFLPWQFLLTIGVFILALTIYFIYKNKLYQRVAR